MDDLRNLVSGSANQEDDARELYRDFDHAFLEVYPDFVVQLNALLKEEARYDLKKYQLNTELRIFALMRLGISMFHRASFFRYSVQTIYNYRSKVLKAVIICISSRESEKNGEYISKYPLTHLPNQLLMCVVNHF